MKRIILGAALAVIAAGAQAEGDVITYDFDGAFEDATFAIENAIVNRGLVIDHVSHVGEMLNRTAADVGAEVQVFEEADVYLFCSATVSREVMEINPLNIVYCPYGIFVAEREGQVIIGHRDYPGNEMQTVEALLAEIAEEAIGGW